jgi:dTDP-4-dehydrorhamnose 3,5-epimerase
MNNRFTLEMTSLQDLLVLTRHKIQDSRGWFERMFCANELQSILQHRSIKQLNHTSTKQKGSVRGLHFQQPPHAEMKIISCLKGEVFDVAVDLRPKSNTYLNWHAEILSADNFKTLIIPEGFAHGFQTLSNDCEMVYLHTEYYSPQCEDGLNPIDPKIDINWPLLITEISDRDKQRALIP